MTNREKLVELIADKSVTSYQVACELLALFDVGLQFNDTRHGLAFWLDEEYQTSWMSRIHERSRNEQKS